MSTPPVMFYPDGEQTTTTPTPPDVTYIRTREDLLQYEDARFNSLIFAVANYYIVENDQSLWGDILRAVAQELARLEYDYAYDTVNKQAIYLTPPDIKRRWAAPLYINRLYPTTDPVQYDLDYKMMLVNLLPAYGMGATVAALEAIITAYTGLNIQVLELYKFIGQGFFDQSDRNAISVSVNVGGDNPLDDITQLNQLQAITNALYGAIDLGKPAHVGLEFKTVFGTNEDVTPFVSTSYTNVNDEPYTIDSPFTYTVQGQPFRQDLGVTYLSGPKTGYNLTRILTGIPTVISGIGQYSVNTTTGTYTFATGDAGNQVSIEYNWTSNPSGIYDQLRIIIRLVENPPFNPMLWQAPDLLASTPKTGLGPSQVLTWTPNTTYAVGQMVLVQGFFQVVITAGTSGVNIPVFNPTFGAHTPDNTVTWSNAGGAMGVILYPATSVYNPGTAYTIFNTVVDPNGFLQIVSVAGTTLSSWVQNTVYTLGQQIIDANGYVQTVTTAGTSGVSNISNLYYPPFDETIGAHTNDGTVVWQTTSLYTWNQKVGGLTIDGTVSWVNIGPPPGLVAPRLLTAWEVKSDQLSVFETS